jgi:hypothetical protein
MPIRCHQHSQTRRLFVIGIDRRLTAASRRRPLTTDELEGRVIVLEAMVMAAVGLAAKRPANFSAELIMEMLNGVKCAIGGRLIREGVAEDGIAEAQRYVDEVLAQFWEHLNPQRSRDQPIEEPRLSRTATSRAVRSRSRSSELRPGSLVVRTSKNDPRPK